MPEVMHSLRAAQKARTVNDVGASVKHRFQQPWVVLRVVLQVGILNQDDVSNSGLKSRSQSRSFSPIPVLKQKMDVLQREERLAIQHNDVGLVLRLSLRKLLQQGPRAIGRAIIDDDYLL